MRLNSKGLADIINANKNNWLYLRIGGSSDGFPTPFNEWGNLNTTYDGSNVTGAIDTLAYYSQSTDSNFFTTEYLITPDFSGYTIDKVFLAAQESGSEVVSYDSVSEISPEDKYIFKIKYEIEIIR
jgi:hypothetical protein